MGSIACWVFSDGERTDFFFSGKDAGAEIVDFAAKLKASEVVGGATEIATETN